MISIPSGSMPLLPHNSNLVMELPGNFSAIALTPPGTMLLYSKFKIVSELSTRDLNSRSVIFFLPFCSHDIFKLTRLRCRFSGILLGFITYFFIYLFRYIIYSLVEFSARSDSTSSDSA